MTLGAVLGAAILVGCTEKKKDPPPRADTGAIEAGADAATATDAATAQGAGGGDASADDPCGDDSPPRSGKSIGHTSVVFKLELGSGKKVAWKPNARRVKGRYRGEIAAYRLGVAFGLPNVPPACARAFDRAEAAAALAANEPAAKLFREEAIAEDGKVRGAAIPWIDGLQFWALDKEPLRSDVRGWLTAGRPIPAGMEDLARQASLLVAFDFITGNWDRYSGGNVGLDRAGRTVLFIDNDAAFMESIAPDLAGKNRALLDSTDRHSRSLVARLRTLDEERVAAAIGDEAPGRPLLPRSAIAAVARRIAELLHVVDAKIAARGESETLFFP